MAKSHFPHGLGGGNNHQTRPTVFDQAAHDLVARLLAVSAHLVSVPQVGRNSPPLFYDDKDDACPDLTGVHSDDPILNGCPPDSDGDGIRDDVDACPNEKGKADPDPQKSGCPTSVRVTEQEIVILEQVRFKTGSAVILKASDELLFEVAVVMSEHPEIRKIEVQGHTDNRGGKRYNLKLSDKRAASVVKWLVKKGDVEAARLSSLTAGNSYRETARPPFTDRQADQVVQSFCEANLWVARRARGSPGCAIGDTHAHPRESRNRTARTR